MQTRFDPDVPHARLNMITTDRSNAAANQYRGT